MDPHVNSEKKLSQIFFVPHLVVWNIYSKKMIISNLTQQLEISKLNLKRRRHFRFLLNNFYYSFFLHKNVARLKLIAINFYYIFMLRFFSSSLSVLLSFSSPPHNFYNRKKNSSTSRTLNVDPEQQINIENLLFFVSSFFFLTSLHHFTMEETRSYSWKLLYTKQQQTHSRFKQELNKREFTENEETHFIQESKILNIFRSILWYHKKIMTLWLRIKRWKRASQNLLLAEIIHI